jgi:hypothetical protein
MPAMLVDQVIASDLAEPEIERHRRIAKVIAKPLIRLDQDILNDVGGIHAPGQGVIETEANHPAKRFSVSFPQPVGRLGVALLDTT